MEKRVSVPFCGEQEACSVKTRERLNGLLRNFSLSLCLVWGETRPRESVAVISITDLHVTAISLTISLDYLPQI